MPSADRLGFGYSCGTTGRLDLIRPGRLGPPTLPRSVAPEPPICAANSVESAPHGLCNMHDRERSSCATQRALVVQTHAHPQLRCTAINAALVRESCKICRGTEARKWRGNRQIRVCKTGQRGRGPASDAW